MIGAVIDDDAFDAYEVVKKGKKSKYAIFDIDGNSKVSLVKQGDKDASHEDFVGEFEDITEKAAYAVYSFCYTTDE